MAFAVASGFLAGGFALGLGTEDGDAIILRGETEEMRRHRRFAPIASGNVLIKRESAISNVAFQINMQWLKLNVLAENL